MRKKYFIASVFVFLVMSMSVQAKMAIGGAFSGIYDNPAGNAALSISHEKIPGTILNFSFALSTDSLNIGISDDWWLKTGRFNSLFGYYIGLGAYTSIGTGNGFSLDAGARIPIALQIWPMDSLEFFIEVAPNMGVGLSPSVRFPVIGGQGAIGFRFWF